MRGIFLKILIVVVILFLAIVYKNHDPSAGDSLFPPCPFYSTTGYKCPGCGSQRAAHALLNGEIGRAWSYNPLLLFFLPYLILAGLAEYANVHVFGEKGSEFLTHRKLIWAFFILIIGFWLWRNLI